MDNNFPPESRLRRPDEFSRVFRLGRRVRCGCLQLRFVRNEHGGARLGLAIAKKHYKRAVDRNRIKRVLRETFRHQRARLQPGDYVVHLLPHKAPVSDAELKAAATRLFEQNTLHLRPHS